MSGIVFFALALVMGVAAQRLLKGVVVPAVFSGVTTGILFHVIGFVVEGRLDSLVMISFVTVPAAAFLISLVLGWVMVKAGKKSRGKLT